MDDIGFMYDFVRIVNPESMKIIAEKSNAENVDSMEQ